MWKGRPQTDNRAPTCRDDGGGWLREECISRRVIDLGLRFGERGCQRGQPRRPSTQTIANERQIFRFETFGDEQFWTDTLDLNDVIEKAVDPTTALKVGLKVDADALPSGILDKVDLKRPATTVALLKMNAIVGVKAEVDPTNHITRLGITCALCHSTV